MAYISAKETAQIRTALKEAFPELRFSVQNRHHSEVAVSIMKGSIDFSDILEGQEHVGLNHFWLENYGHHSDLFEAILMVIKRAGTEWYDRSDSQTDYFDTAFYITMAIGKWNKPYQLDEKLAKHATPEPFLQRAKTSVAMRKLETA